MADRVRLAAKTPLSDAGQRADTSLLSNMLSRDTRVSHTLFDTIMEHGKSFHTPFLSLRYYFLKDTAQNKDGSRISVSVPKKVSLKATYRNKLRRKLYPIVRLYKDRLPQGSASIVFVKKDIAELDSKKLQQEVKYILEKAFNVVL